MNEGLKLSFLLLKVKVMNLKGFLAETCTRQDAKPKFEENQIRIIKFQDMQKKKTNL